MDTVVAEMNTENNADWETPRYNRRSNTYTPPHARRADEPPPAPRRPKRSEEFPALVKGAPVRPTTNQTLESRFNDLAREMQEERERQQLAEAAEEAERVRRSRLPAGFVLMPPPPQTGPYTRFRRCDGLTIQAAPMEFREEDWEPLSGSNTDDEGEQNTDLADHHDRH